MLPLGMRLYSTAHSFQGCAEFIIIISLFWLCMVSNDTVKNTYKLIV